MSHGLCLMGWPMDNKVIKLCQFYNNLCHVYIYEDNIFYSYASNSTIVDSSFVNLLYWLEFHNNKR